MTCLLQRSEEEKVKKARERVREKEEREKANKDKAPKEPSGDSTNHVKSGGSSGGGGGDHRPPSPKHSRERSRSKTPPKKTKSPPPDHSRSPTRPSSHTKSTDRAERLKAKEAERVKEKEESARDEEEYEQRLQARKQREREKAYKEVTSNLSWFHRGKYRGGGRGDFAWYNIFQCTKVRTKIYNESRSTVFTRTLGRLHWEKCWHCEREPEPQC